MDHEISINLIKDCLLGCSRNDPECREQYDEHWRPTLLLHISSAHRFNIVLGKQLPFRSDVVYMSLSHCWGDHVPMQLLTSNMHTFVSGCDLEILPLTFQDAISQLVD